MNELIPQDAFLEWLWKYAQDIHLLCMDFCSLFKHNSTRHEGFKEVKKEIKVEFYKF